MKRTIFLLFLLFVAHCTAFSQGMVWSKNYQDYFDKYKKLAVKQMQKYKIPASITLAQGALESGAGKSELAMRGKNHFGIKCNGWTGRRSYHDDDERNECFRAYNSVEESYEDHSVFLTTSRRYAKLFQLKMKDYKGWAKGLKACGYATNPAYAKKLIEIIELYQLDRYDSPEGAFYKFNNNYYVYARRGDTFRSLASEVGVSRRKLARYNERDVDDVLEEGEIVWLKKKARKAPKEFKGRPHIVKAGESMYTIAQKYGIRLKYLYKMNGLAPDYVISVGDALRIR